MVIPVEIAESIGYQYYWSSSLPSPDTNTYRYHCRHHNRPLHHYVIIITTPSSLPLPSIRHHYHLLHVLTTGHHMVTSSFSPNKRHHLSSACTWYGHHAMKPARRVIFMGEIELAQKVVGSSSGYYGICLWRRRWRSAARRIAGVNITTVSFQGTGKWRRRMDKTLATIALYEGH